MNKEERVINKLEELRLVQGLHEFIMENGFVAGGAIRDVARGVVPKDWDIFFRSNEAKDAFIAKFAKACTETGIGNYNYRDFQFITLRTGSPEEIIGGFDWNVNQKYYCPKTRALDTYIESHLLINNKAEKPLAALLRLPYMLKKGFTIEERCYLYALSFVAMSVNLGSPEAVKEQQEFISSGGGSVDIADTINRAANEALKNSPLMKALE